jgi:hypothetical protein
LKLQTDCAYVVAATTYTHPTAFIVCTGTTLPLTYHTPSLLYNGYRVSFPGVKRPGRGVDHPLPSSAEVKDRVELYLYSTSSARRQNLTVISHPSLLTACQMALAVTSGLSKTCAVSGLVTLYINGHDHRNLRKEAPNAPRLERQGD